MGRITFEKKSTAKEYRKRYCPGAGIYKVKGGYRITRKKKGR